MKGIWLSDLLRDERMIHELFQAALGEGENMTCLGLSMFRLVRTRTETSKHGRAGFENFDYEQQLRSECHQSGLLWLGSKTTIEG